MAILGQKHQWTLKLLMQSLLLSVNLLQHSVIYSVYDMDMRFHFVAFCALLTPRDLNPV